MTWVSIDNKITLNVLSKVGSHSIYSSLSPFSIRTLTDNEASTYGTRLMFVRNPIARLESAFNHFYWMELGLGDYFDFLPKGIITACGARASGLIGSNDYRLKGIKAADIQDKIALAITEIGEDKPIEIALSLNNKDWIRFVDYVLSGGIDDHWKPQLDQAKDKNGKIICNVVHRFEDISKYWLDYFPGELTTLNSWAPVAKSEYRLAELQNYYAEDIALWGAINGTWHPDI